MKIMKFLNETKSLLLYNTDIHLPTFKLIITTLTNTLSKKENFRWKTEIDYLLNFTNTQQSLYKSISLIKTNELEKQLNTLKNDKND